jgi:hypothetical protein
MAVLVRVATEAFLAWEPIPGSLLVLSAPVRGLAPDRVGVDVTG